MGIVQRSCRGVYQRGMYRMRRVGGHIRKGCERCSVL